MTISATALRSASAPPEVVGLGRDDVRLMVVTPESVRHETFPGIVDLLEGHDLMVVNDSRTMAAALPGRHGFEAVDVHVSGPARDGWGWIVELRRADRSGPILDARPGGVVELELGGRVELIAGADTPGRLHRAVLRGGPVDAGGIIETLRRHGRPIRYDYVDDDWGIDRYQTIFARESPEFGSAEMPSAARPITARVASRLIAKGVAIAPITLHAGVSSLETGEPPRAERFSVPDTTAAAVDRARQAGGRVIAVGTTVVRALETMSRPGGRIAAGTGWTELVLGPKRPATVPDGIVTGWHPPEASHLDLITAVVGPETTTRAYRAAHCHGGYQMHEFGDSALLFR